MERLTIDEARAANDRIIGTLTTEAGQQRARTLYRIVPTGQNDDWTCNSSEWETLLNTVYPKIDTETMKRAQYIITN